MKYSVGLSTVELLVTLFVAVSFLIAGVQLYNIVVNSSVAARTESSMRDVGYEHLRRFSSGVAEPCAASVPLTRQPVTLGIGGNAYVTVTVSCPKPSLSSISRVSVLVERDGSNSVEFSSYATKK